MRCRACDTGLSDFEATRKYAAGGFVDLCNKCFYPHVAKQIHVVEREDLRGIKENEEDEEKPDDNDADSFSVDLNELDEPF